LHLFACFGFESWLLGLANVLQYGGVSFFFFAGVKKKQNKFQQIYTVLSKS
jgi:hypothetical protein